MAAEACFAPGACGPVLDAVEDVVDEADDDLVLDDVEDDAPGVTGRPVVGLMPGGVSESGAGVALCPVDRALTGDEGNPRRRAGGRRFALVETKPVVPAPEPGALA